MERVAVLFEIPTNGSGPMGVTCARNLTNRSASSLPVTSECPGNPDEADGIFQRECLEDCFTFQQQPGSYLLGTECLDGCPAI